MTPELQKLYDLADRIQRSFGNGSTREDDANRHRSYEATIRAIEKLLIEERKIEPVLIWIGNSGTIPGFIPPFKIKVK